LHNLSEHQALIEMARKCNFLFPGEDERLLRHLGKNIPPGGRSGRRGKPRLDDEGKLWFRDQIIRRLSLRKVATKVEQLVQAFQASGWPRRIPNPFADNVDPQYIHKAVNLANSNLLVIRFEVLRQGTVVAWVRR
jgi:hypothetical protein